VIVECTKYSARLNHRACAVGREELIVERQSRNISLSCPSFLLLSQVLLFQIRK